MNPPGQGIAIEMPADQIWEMLHLLGRFLQQQQVGLIFFHQQSDILDRGTDQAQEIPADNLHPAAILRLSNATTPNRDHKTGRKAVAGIFDPPDMMGERPCRDKAP